MTYAINDIFFDLFNKREQKEITTRELYEKLLNKKFKLSVTRENQDLLAIIGLDDYETISLKKLHKLSPKKFYNVFNTLISVKAVDSEKINSRLKNGLLAYYNYKNKYYKEKKKKTINREALRESMLEKSKDKDYIKRRDYNKKIYMGSPMYKQSQSDYMKERHKNDPRMKETIKKRIKTQQTKEYRNKRALQTFKLWNDKEYVDKVERRRGSVTLRKFVSNNLTQDLMDKHGDGFNINYRFYYLDKYKKYLNEIMSEYENVCDFNNFGFIVASENKKGHEELKKKFMKYYNNIKNIGELEEDECRGLALNKLFNHFKKVYHEKNKEKYSRSFQAPHDYVTKMIKIRDGLEEVLPREEWDLLETQEEYSSLIYNFLQNVDDVSILCNRDKTPVIKRDYFYPFIEEKVKQGLSYKQAKNLMLKKIAYPPKKPIEEYDYYEKRFFRIRKKRIMRVINNEFPFELPNASYKKIPYKMSLEEFVKEHINEEVIKLFHLSKKDKVTRYYLDKYQDYVTRMYNKEKRVDFSTIASKNSLSRLEEELETFKKKYDTGSEKKDTLKALKDLFSDMKAMKEKRWKYRIYTRKFAWKLEFVIDQRIMGYKIKEVMSEGAGDEEEFMQIFYKNIRGEVKSKMKRMNKKNEEELEKFLINDKTFNLLFEVRDRNKIRKAYLKYMKIKDLSRVITDDLIKKIIKQDYADNNLCFLKRMRFRMDREISERKLFTKL